ncbi:MAG TPA: hypothetical protein VGH98_25440 [Gemmatimonadaceae bacterium]|jgi:hypothetical protein
MHRHATVLALTVAVGLIVACAADRGAAPRREIRQSGSAFLKVPCSDDPSQPGCDGSTGPGSPTVDSTLIPLCSTVGGSHAESTTPASDTSIAVKVDGPLFIRGCRGPAIWHATVLGNAGSVHYRWYYSACAGLYNYCGAGFGLAAEGDNTPDLSTTLTVDIRTVFVYVEVKDMAGKLLTGVSGQVLTKGPAWGADGGLTFKQPCFVADYPFGVEVTTYPEKYTELTWAPNAYFQTMDPYYVPVPNWYYYSRNYCNGNREFNPVTGSPTKPAGSTP